MTNSSMQPMAICPRLSVRGLAAACAFLLACVATSAQAQSSRQTQPTQTYLDLMTAGRYADAADLVDAAQGDRARQKEDRGEVDNRSLQLYLMKASALQWAGSEGALASYEAAEAVIKSLETRVGGAGVLESVGAAFVGAGAKAYRPRASDGILVNTFKAELFLLRGKHEDARIELNRSDERARRLVEMLYKEIELAKQSAEGRKGVSERADTIISEHYPNLSEWDVYDDFVNPYSVYLHAIFFFAASEASSDIEKSIESMKRLVGMYPESEHLAEQLGLFERIASGQLSREALPDQVWVVCADGMGPAIGVKRVQAHYQAAGGMLSIRVRKSDGRGQEELLPIPIVQPNPAAFDGCGVSAEGSPLATASEIASMDRLFLTEFKKRLPMEITQSIFAYALGGNAMAASWRRLRSDLGARDNALGNTMDSSLETRVWQGLPKKWFATRVDRPASGELTISGTQGAPIATIQVPESRMSLVVVRAPSRSAAPAVSVSVLAERK